MSKDGTDFKDLTPHLNGVKEFEAVRTSNLPSNSGSNSFMSGYLRDERWEESLKFEDLTLGVRTFELASNFEGELNG